MSDLYIDPIIKKYQDLIKAAIPGLFKFYYQGDPIMVPKSNIPALILSKTQTRIGNHDSAADEHEISLVLTVITDMRDEISPDKSIEPGIAQLYDIIEGRQTATYALKSTSLLHILRSNILVDAAMNLRTDVGSITRADYGLTVGKRDRDTYAIEGRIEFVATFSQNRS